MLDKGELDSVSVIVTTGAFDDFARQLRKVKVPIFLHFSITEGTPISEKTTIPSLLDDEGRFYAQQTLIKKCISRKINKQDVWRELEAQMEKLLKAGVRVAGIDTHQHAHAFNPISAVVYEYATERNIEFVRSYSQARAISISAHIVKFGYWLLALGTSLRLSPRSWRERKWRSFVMATWEKISSVPDDTVVIVHPGTDFDCQESLLRQVIRHFRYIKNH